MAARVSDHPLHQFHELLIPERIRTYHLESVTHPLEFELDQLPSCTDRYHKVGVVLTPIQGIPFVYQIFDKALDLPAIETQLEIAIFHFVTFIHGNPSS